jgi:hypothetical protein
MVESHGSQRERAEKIWRKIRGKPPRLGYPTNSSKELCRMENTGD